MGFWSENRKTRREHREMAKAYSELDHTPGFLDTRWYNPLGWGRGGRIWQEDDFEYANPAEAMKDLEMGIDKREANYGRPIAYAPSKTPEEISSENYQTHIDEMDKVEEIRRDFDTNHTNPVVVGQTELVERWKEAVRTYKPVFIEPPAPPVPFDNVGAALEYMRKR